MSNTFKCVTCCESFALDNPHNKAQKRCIPCVEKVKSDYNISAKSKCYVLCTKCGLYDKYVNLVDKRYCISMDYNMFDTISASKSLEHMPDYNYELCFNCNKIGIMNNRSIKQGYTLINEPKTKKGHIRDVQSRDLEMWIVEYDNIKYMFTGQFPDGHTRYNINMSTIPKSLMLTSNRTLKPKHQETKNILIKYMAIKTNLGLDIANLISEYYNNEPVIRELGRNDFIPEWANRPIFIDPDENSEML